MAAGARGEVDGSSELRTKKCHGLVEVQRIRVLEVETAMLAVTRQARQISHSEVQLSKLIAFRNEYGRMSRTDSYTPPRIYQDRQLFMQRLGANIDLLSSRVQDMKQEKQKAMSELRVSRQKADALGKGLKKLAARAHETENKRLQTQCDESVRNTPRQPLNQRDAE